MNFAEMLTKLTATERARTRRVGWNGKGMYLFLVADWDINDAPTPVMDDDGEAEYMPFICMRTADQKLVPWLASQTDILATDWEIL